ncbi:MAG: DUF6165 family protein [Synechococcaceae cyanobacterium MAG-AL1]|nr:DUF6165 family protein [Candidatus Regnicoccus frigidus MAG-AL1]
MDHDSSITISVAPGELIDRLTILLIKEARITDSAKLLHIREDLAGLAASLAAIPEEQRQQIAPLLDDLLTINACLWEVEESLRACESAGVFDSRFVWMARCVYLLNDGRAGLKRAISLAAGSRILEEKSYV